MFKQTAIGFFCCLLWAGCASIDPQSAPRDWPRLTIDVRKVSYLEVLKRCSKYSVAPLACAEIHFRTMTCYVWVTPDAPRWVLDHELGHCHGADHFGESTLRDAWASYKAKP